MIMSYAFPVFEPIRGPGYAASRLMAREEKGVLLNIDSGTFDFIAAGSATEYAIRSIQFHGRTDDHSRLRRRDDRRGRIRSEEATFHRASGTRGPLDRARPSSRLPRRSSAGTC